MVRRSICKAPGPQSAKSQAYKVPFGEAEEIAGSHLTALARLCGLKVGFCRTNPGRVSKFLTGSRTGTHQADIG
jgi:hypothetical protein